MIEGNEKVATWRKGGTMAMIERRFDGKQEQE